MIYGALGDIEEYRGMLKGLDVLIDWLEENDPAEQPSDSGRQGLCERHGSHDASRDRGSL